MYQFYKFVAHTPIDGEEQEYYAAVPMVYVGGLHFTDENYLRDLGASFAEDNADDWWDAEHAELYDEDEYFSESYCECVEVSYEEAREHLPFWTLDELEMEEEEE